LRSPPEFQVKLSVDFKAPKAQEVVDRLRAVTGVELTLDDSVDREQAAFGSLSFRNAPAWVVMEQLAKSKYIQGRWERAGDGYRLIGTVKTAQGAGQQADPAPLRARLWLTVLSLLFFLLIGLLIVFFERRLARKAARPSG
jgi:hypothetical protein